jgi:hypothetical protein
MKNQRKHITQSSTTVIQIAVVLVAFVCVGAVRADDIQQQLDLLRGRLDAVQQDTSEMRDSLDDLKAESEKDWMTEERADEIRLLVHDVLADADARTSLVGDGVLGGWSDGFFLASSDGRFKLTIGGLMQERFLMNYQKDGFVSSSDRWRGGLENTRTRLDIGGYIFDRDTSFYVQAGWGYLDPNALSGNPLLRIGARLWDSWIKFKLNEQWSAKVGVFMLPFTRESLVSDKYQMAVDRSLMDYRLGLARSQGIEFTWAHENKRVFLSTTNGSITLNGIPAGAGNPTPPWGALQQDAEWAFTARAEFLLEGNWAQFKQFTSPMGSEQATMVGIAVHGQQGERTGGGGPKQDQYGVTADLSMNFDGMSFFLSGTMHNQKNVSAAIPNADWVGYLAQASTYMTDKTELFMRFEGGGVRQNSMGGDDVHILTTGVNWYLDGQGLKVTSDVGWSLGEISTGMQNWMVGWRATTEQNSQWLFRTQLQLAF